MIVQPLIAGLFPLYSIIIAASAAIGLGLSARLSEDQKLRVVEVGIVMLAAGLLGARIGYILLNLSYFMDHLGQIPQIWSGGLVWSGGLIAAGAGLWGASRFWNEPLGELADRLLPLLGTLVVALWLTGWWLGIG